MFIEVTPWKEAYKQWVNVEHIVSFRQIEAVDKQSKFTALTLINGSLSVEENPAQINSLVRDARDEAHGDTLRVEGKAVRR